MRAHAIVARGTVFVAIAANTADEGSGVTAQWNAKRSWGSGWEPPGLFRRRRSGLVTVGQRHPDAAAGEVVGLFDDGDRAVVQLDQPLRDGEAEAGAAARGAGAAGEALEDAFAIGRGDAGALVGDLDHHAGAVAAAHDRDRAGVGAVPGGVVDEVG